jgi:exonuclease III
VFLEETSRSRSYSEDYKQKQKEHHSFKIGTWNVRTFNQGGKLENLKKEMQMNAVSVLGVNEVRWKGHGEIRSGDYTVNYSGGERAERGVAIVVHESLVKSVVKKSVYSDRIIPVKFKAEPVSILIVQFYMPTSEYEDDEVEELCDIIEDILEEDGKGATNTIIMGDWNSVVGDKAHDNTVDHMDWEGRIREVKCLLTSVKEMDLL